MKVFKSILIVFIIQISFIHAQVNLTGSWTLYNAAGGEPAGTVIMSINHVGSEIKASGPNWTGVGTYNFTTNKGSYSWKFTDGKTGTTTFTYHPDYDIIHTGYVKGTGTTTGIDWEFIGRRTNSTIKNFSGSYKKSKTSLIFHTFKQTGNYIDFFHKATEFYHYGSGYIFGNMAIVNYTRTHVSYPTVTGTGQFYFFLSNDLKSIWVNPYQLDPPESNSKGFIFTKLPSVSLVSPPPGWIGTDGKQDCIQSGSGSRLSCQSGDDFTESGYCLDPRTILIIDDWLSKARPFYGWDKAYFDCWGRWVGVSRNGEARGNCHRPETDGKTRCEYLLAHIKTEYPDVDASILPSMSLESYLLRQLTKD